MAAIMCSIVLLLATLLQSGAAQDSLSYRLQEDKAPNVVIANIYQDSGLITKYPDKLDDLQFSFLEELHKSLFSISSGELQTIAEVDRDSICENVEQCILQLDIKVGPSQYFEIIKVLVEIIDDNDHAPSFGNPAIRLSLKESASVGTRLVVPTASDPDSPIFGVQRYNLLTQTEQFELKVTDNDDNTKEVSLVLLKPVDRETRNLYELELQAVDGGTPPKYGRVQISVDIIDVNDNSPVFENSTYTAIIPESTAKDTVILKVQASDKDQDAVISYAFNEKTASTYGDLFDIDTKSGEIKLEQQLNYEESSVYVLTVTAQDNPDSVPSSAKVTVTVTDSNDNAPAIKLNLDPPGSMIQISESSPIGHFVAHITVIDSDSEERGRFECTLNTDLFKLEQLYETEFKIVTATKLDREAKGMYDVLMTCVDYGTPSMSSQQKLTINIQDENDNSPQFLLPSYDGSILEHTPPGAFIAQVQATDKDIGDNQVIRYSIEDAASSIFRIHPVNGNITTIIELDHEKVSKIQFKVYAVDKGQPPMTSTANVIVDIIDTDDEKPEFLQDSYTFAAFENGVGVQEVGQVQAHDADSELFNDFRYSITDSQDIFTIDPESGVISTRITLDRESVPKYDVTVLAIGLGIKPRTSSASVTIYVADENDHAPKIVFPSGLNNTLYISNKASTGSVISRIQSSDEDAGPNAQVEFIILSGNEEGYFALDPVSGIVTIAKTLAEIENQAFGMIIKVHDGGQPPRATEAFLNIIVNKSISVTDGQAIFMSGQNLTIVVAIACVSGVIMVVLLVAIVAIIRQQRRRSEAERKYVNIPKILERNVSPGGSDASSSDISGKKKKEVSFDNVALDLEYAERDQTKYGDDDDDSACSLAMSNADSGRGSNDGDSHEQQTPSKPQQHQQKPPSYNNIQQQQQQQQHQYHQEPIRTNQLESGVYNNYNKSNISNLFARDVLYRSERVDTPPERPPRQPTSSRSGASGPQPPRGAGEEVIYGKPVPRRSLVNEDLIKTSSCPVHSPGGRHYSSSSSSVGGSTSGGGAGSSGAYHRQQPALPPRKYKDDIVLTGVVDSEIHV